MVELSRERMALLVDERLTANGISVVGIDFDDTLLDTKSMFRNAIYEGCGLLIYGDELPDVLQYDENARQRINKFKENTFEPVLNGLRGEYGITPVIMELAMDITARLSNVFAGTTNYDLALARMRAIYETDILRPYKGAHELVDTLNASGVETILMTHAKADWTRRKREMSGFYGKFSRINCFSVYETKEEQWGRSLSWLGIDPHDFLTVGDNKKTDIIPTVLLGARAIWIDNGAGAERLTTQKEKEINDEVFNANVIRVEKTSKVLEAIITQM